MVTFCDHDKLTLWKAKCQGSVVEEFAPNSWAKFAFLLHFSPGNTEEKRQARVHKKMEKMVDDQIREETL